MLRKIIGNFLKNSLPGIFFSTKSYSQDGEDLLIMSYYKYKNRKHKGFYVDIGAHHPYRFSNTAVFYKKGWRGINIEPTPKLIQLFYKFRKRDINLNIAVSDKQGSLNFYEFNEPSINSFDEKLSLDRSKYPQYKLISKKEIPVYTLSDILNKHLPENQKIDFFSIDVEGHDLNILKSNDWYKYRPRFILIEGEIGNKNHQSSEMHLYLNKLGYSIVGFTKRNYLYETPQDSAE